MQLSLIHRDFEASFIFSPSLTRLTLPTVTCQDQHSLSGGAQEKGKGLLNILTQDRHLPSLFASDNSKKMVTKRRVKNSKTDATIRNADKKKNGGPQSNVVASFKIKEGKTNHTI